MQLPINYIFKTNLGGFQICLDRIVDNPENLCSRIKAAYNFARESRNGYEWFGSTRDGNDVVRFKIVPPDDYENTHFTSILSKFYEIQKSADENKGRAREDLGLNEIKAQIDSLFAEDEFQQDVVAIVELLNNYRLLLNDVDKVASLKRKGRQLDKQCFDVGPEQSDGNTKHHLSVQIEKILDFNPKNAKDIQTLSLLIEEFDVLLSTDVRRGLVLFNTLKSKLKHVVVTQMSDNDKKIIERHKLALRVDECVSSLKKYRVHYKYRTQIEKARVAVNAEVIGPEERKIVEELERIVNAKPAVDHEDLRVLNEKIKKYYNKQNQAHVSSCINTVKIFKNTSNNLVKLQWLNAHYEFCKYGTPKPSKNNVRFHIDVYERDYNILSDVCHYFKDLIDSRYIGEYKEHLLDLYLAIINNDQNKAQQHIDHLNKNMIVSLKWAIEEKIQEVQALNGPKFSRPVAQLKYLLTDLRKMVSTLTLLKKVVSIMKVEACV